jgi:mannonate dehydratase
MHERPHPIQSIAMCKEVERYHPFFMEAPFSPEDVGYFKLLRPQCSTPLAMGELFNNPNEWVSLVSGRLIDFIRIHISQVGGLTMARKVAAMCEFFRVGPPGTGRADVSRGPRRQSPSGPFDVELRDPGEATVFNDAAKDVVGGATEIKHGMLWANDRPGLGVDFKEELAAKFPIQDDPPFDLDWGRLRGSDGTIRRP